MSIAGRLSVWATLLSATGCVAGSGPVVRVVDGQEQPGRFIAPEAYSAYARAAELEARGELEEAARALELAADEDPSSVEIRTRQADLSCRMNPRSGLRGFAQAESVDPSYEPLWRARARCHARRGELDAAESAALRAVALDPNRVATSLLAAELLEKNAKPARARRWLLALVARHPGSRPAWEALRGLAERQRDAALLRHAEHQLRQRSSEGSIPDPEATEIALRAALADRDLEQARSLALSARLAPAQLALRAAALGYARAARQQAELVLAADPGNADARVALLVALDLLADDSAFAGHLGPVPEPYVPLSPLGAELWTELLERRVGPEAAAAWRSALGGPPERSAPTQ